MSARTPPVSFSRPFRPGMLYGTDVAESAHGITEQPLQAESWSAESGASDAAKSTVRAVMAAMPAPEPVGEYVMLIPYAFPTSGIHFEMSGNGNVAPVPTSDVSAALAGAACACPATSAI